MTDSLFAGAAINPTWCDARRDPVVARRWSRRASVAQPDQATAGGSLAVSPRSRTHGYRRRQAVYKARAASPEWINADLRTHRQL